MKRMISLALALVLALSVISSLALAEDKKWPAREMTGTPVELRTSYFKNLRWQTFAGPSRRYALSGAFLTRRVNKATALLREGDSVLVDLDYATAKRVVYFEKDTLVSADVPEEKLEGVDAKTKAVVYPVFYGPGKDYDIVTQRTRSKYADLPLTELEELFDGDIDMMKRALKEVFFEVNGWVYIEPSQCSIGAARFWVPADAVE